MRWANESGALYLLNLLAVVRVHIAASNATVELLELTKIFPRGAFGFDFTRVTHVVKEIHRHFPIRILYYGLPRLFEFVELAVSEFPVSRV